MVDVSPDGPPEPNPSEEASEPRSKASVVDLAFALWAVLAPLLVHDRLLNGDGDLARHLVLGEHILGEGPRFLDVFSFTRAGEPFLAYEWLSQVVFHLLHRVGGLPLVAVFAGIVLASAVALVVAYVRRHGGDPWLAFMTGALAAVLTGPHWIARPHLFTILALPVLLLLLDVGRRRYLGIAGLFAVWANLHPGFLYGLVILLFVLAGRLVEEKISGGLKAKAWMGAGSLFALALGASFLNPFGWSLHTHAILHAGSTELLAAVNEFQAVDLLSGYGLLVMATTTLVVVGLSAQTERVSLDALGAFLLGLFATLAVRRNGPLLAVAGLPMVARALTPVVGRLPEWFAGRMRREFKRSDGSSRKASVGALLILAGITLLGGRVGSLTLIPDAFSEEEFPVEAVERAREAGLSGRLLSEYTWGGYVLYAWPGQKVFVDSMADFFGPELVYRYSMMRDAGPEWREYLRSYEISLVLLSPSAPLASELSGEPGWDLWHGDATAVLFVRASESVGRGGLSG